MPAVLTDPFWSKPTVALAEEIHLHEAASVNRHWIGTGLWPSITYGGSREREHRVQAFRPIQLLD